MKVQKKISFIFIITWVLIVIFTYCFLNLYLKENYRKIEEQSVINKLKDIDSTLFAIFGRMTLINNDWTNWDDSYTFIQDLNPKYIALNLSLASFNDFKLDMLIFFDKNGYYKFGRFFDSVNQKFIDKPQDLESSFPSTSILFHPKDLTTSNTGIIKLKKGFILFASRSILHSDATGPSAGTLVMGLYLHNVINSLSRTIDTPITLYSIEEIQKTEKLRSVFQYLLHHNYYSLQKNDEQIQGFSLFKDFNGNPVGIFEITLPRTVWMQGIKSMNRFFIVLLVIGFVSIILLWLLNKLFIVKPLLKLKKEVANVNLKNKKFIPIKKVSKNNEISDITETINYILGSLNDLYDEKEKYLQKFREIKKNLQEANHDSLTGLASKLLFNDLLSHLIGDAKLHAKILAVLLLDIDHFKKINDIFGHKVGDIFLQNLAIKLEKRLPQPDFVSRFSGDSFAFVVFDFKNIAALEQLLVIILNLVSETQTIAGQQIQLTGSIGVAIYPNDGSSTEELLNNAEIAMYNAKSEGGNKYKLLQKSNG